MRSQATKQISKKGALTKPTLKSISPTRQVKKKLTTTKKIKKLMKKDLIKTQKNASKSEQKEGKSDAESAGDDKSEDETKPGPSKTSGARSDSPTKKAKSKKDSKEKKDPIKSSTDSLKIPKKSNILAKKCKVSPKSKGNKIDNNSDDVKYKINTETGKKGTAKSVKSKVVLKKGPNTNPKKKHKPVNKLDSKTSLDTTKQQQTTELNISESERSNSESDKNKLGNIKSEDSKSMVTSPTVSTTVKSTVDAPKSESERPPKFFTSSRSPRMVDIDVKCKSSKGNLSVSERFVSLKTIENKIDETQKEKSSPSSTLVSQGQEVDVYTFTEKVDSPKSILSDFRSPIPKNVGRVRPIARVKGTIIDKTEKKYSPHRPIEEVVKQLKAKKGNTEENKPNQPIIEVKTALDKSIANTFDDEEKPKAIVSKSYKMVARKSSIPGKPFSPIKFLDQEEPSQSKVTKTGKTVKKPSPKTKTPAKCSKSSTISDDEIDNSTFSINTKSSKSRHYSSSDESITDSNDDNDTKESSESSNYKNKKTKKYKRTANTLKKGSSKELSKDSVTDLKDDSELLKNDKVSKRRLKLLSMWTGPKKHRMASLNAIAKVHCLYENESRTHMELGLMRTVDRLIVPGQAKPSTSKKKETKQKETQDKQDSTTSESEYERKGKKTDSSEDDSPVTNTRSLRGEPGIRSAGKYWDPKSCTSSSEDSELESKKKASQEKKKISPKASTSKSSDSDKPPSKIKKKANTPVKRKRNRNEVIMDLKDMVVQKRMASLNATAILAASYEKRSPKSTKDETTSDSCSDEYFSQKSKNGVSSGVKSETKKEETKKECDETALADRKQKVEVIVNQDTDVTITGVYATHHHEGFCTVAGMQYRISSTSHTQTTATANCDKEGCSREDESRYTPLSALSSMQPPAEHVHHPHPVPELGGLTRRAGCSSAFTAPASASHQEPGKPEPCVLCPTMAPISPYGYYQPAGPLIKESGADAERALARYHPAPHYHPPHPTMLQQYGPPPYYAADLCYGGRYYRPPGPYHMPPQPDSQMVGVSEPYPPPQYYGTPPCYQHSPQRVPYIEYRGCPCPLNACPKNVLIGPATGKAPTGGGPADVPPALAPPGGAFRAKARAARADADTHGSGKDPPLEPEPPAAADAPRPCPLPTIGGASPKREMYDVRDKLRLAGELSSPAEAAGPPSPARGSAGACAPQPPPGAPRRARLGKAMARRSLAGDDTGLLLGGPPPQSSADDDDVMALSPPPQLPIDLSSSDETDRRSTPSVDVKKENEGPTYSPPRKTDAQALKEHNSSATDSADAINPAKAIKRRYSKPKLEIDLRDVELEDGCKTNGIGEHVKLQKRRKVSSELNDLANRTVTATAKEPKKRSPTKNKRVSKSDVPKEKKRNLKRKSSNIADVPSAKRLLTETVINEEARPINSVTSTPEQTLTKSKTKSALLLDNLLRKNSIDRPDSKSFASDSEIDPAELFLPRDSVSQSSRKTLNINNNVIENNAPVNGVKPNTIAAVTQLLVSKKLATKNALKTQKVESKVMQNVKQVLNGTTDQLNVQDGKSDSKADSRDTSDSVNNKVSDIVDLTPEDKTISKLKCKVNQVKQTESILATSENSRVDSNGTQENAIVNNASEPWPADVVDAVTAPEPKTEASERPEKVANKRSKLSIDKPSGDLKCKLGEKAEKVVKLLVSKKSVLKTDEASLVVEDACASPVPVGRARRRRRSTGRRARRAAPPLAPPAAPHAEPRWSNGWRWDGDHHLAKVYLNNDSRQDRPARCWSRMSHASGDRVSRGDCVLLRASSPRAQPFVARVARLWENPEDGEMMVSLVWYYRPEHTELGRQPADSPDEVFASRHRDSNSVACIEDKCYVLTFNEYCRYRKRLKAAEEGIKEPPSIVPPMPASEVSPLVATNDTKLPPSVSPELVLFCRKIYDFRSKKIQVPNK